MNRMLKASISQINYLIKLNMHVVVIVIVIVMVVVKTIIITVIMVMP